MKEKKAIGNSQNRHSKGKYSLTAFHKEKTGLVKKLRSVYVVYLNFKKVFALLSLTVSFKPNGWNMDGLQGGWQTAWTAGLSSQQFNV